MARAPVTASRRRTLPRTCTLQCQLPGPPPLPARRAALARALVDEFGLAAAVLRAPRSGGLHLSLRAERASVLPAVLAAALDRIAESDARHARLLAGERAGGWRMLLNDQVMEFQQALAGCTPEMLDDYPRMRLGLILVMCKDGRLGHAERVWSQLLGGHLRGPLTHLPGWEIKLVRLLYTVYADAPITSQRLRRMRELEAEVSAIEPGMRGIVYNMLCHCSVESGDLEPARHYGALAARDFDAAGSRFGKLYICYQLALADLRLGRTARARACAAEGLRLAGRVRSATQELSAIGRALHLVCEYLSGAGVPPGLLDAVHEVETLDAWSELLWTLYATAADALVLAPTMGSSMGLLARWRVAARERGLPRLVALLELKEIEVALRSGRRTQARLLAERYQLDALARRGVSRDLAWRLPVLRARWLCQQLACAEGRTADRAELAALLQETETGELAELHLRVLLCSAEADLLRGRRQAAARAIGQALARVLPDGLHRTLLDHPGDVVALLDAWQQGQHATTAGAHLRRAAKALMRRARDEAPAESTHSAGLQISRAEARVLEGLVDGCSNREIAQRLGRSIDTVKFHLKNLGRKLGVRRRQDMAARARESGLAD